MNVAILIGVSEYHKLEPLPECKNDIEIMTKLIEATGKYDGNILSISENTNAKELKKKITDKIDELKSNDIDELFFYYTGHGCYDKGEFYYLLSDYDKEKRNQTSLGNIEMDNWFRSLSPKITFKVVDACNSGFRHIKDEGQALHNYLSKSSEEFGTNYKKCYFMFSSEFDGDSYTNDKTGLSYFTECFIDSFDNRESSENMRYMDIIDFIRDNFQNRSFQTPFFVIQADSTEEYCKINSNIINLFTKSSVIANVDVTSDVSSNLNITVPSIETKTLVSAVKNDAESYITKEEAFKLLEDMKATIKDHKYPEEFESLYELDKSFIKYDDYDNTPELNDISYWLDTNDNNYFAEVEYKEVPIPVKPKRNIFGLPLLNYPVPEKTEYKKVISGFKLTVELPYELIKIEGNPKHENIPYVECIIAFVLSKNEIRYFICNAIYKNTSWDDVEIDDKRTKWFTSAIKFNNKEFIPLKIEKIQNDFVKYILGFLKEKFRILEE